MAAPPTDALDLLRFLALSLEVHTDALCCAVDDVEAAIVESAINDELMDRLEEELAGLLDRQRRLHAGRAIIALSQQERQRGSEVRRDLRPSAQVWGDKRIQVSRAPPRATSTASAQPSLGGGQSALRAASHDDGASTRGLSTAEVSLEADVAAVDRQVESLKRRIEALDCYSLRGKLLQLEKMKRTVKDVDLAELVETIVNEFQFPPAVQALWASDVAETASASSFISKASVPSRGASNQSRLKARSEDVTLAQYAAGRGHVVNHTNLDLLIARACQRLAGRSVDALDALSSTTVSEDSAAAHVLGCMVYAAEFERSERGELQSVIELQTMEKDALSRLYRQWEREAICTADIDPRCFGARDTVLAPQDFSALPADWATTKSLSRIPVDELLPPIRHLLCPRFTFANRAELLELQAARVELQRTIVRFLLGGADTDAELLQSVARNATDHTAAMARLAVADTTAPTVTGHAWKTLVRVPHDS